MAGVIKVLARACYVISVLSLVVFLTLSQSVEAAGWSLQWVAPEGCSQVDDLKQAVERRLKREVFGAGAGLRISGATTRRGAGWAASLTLSDSRGAVLGAREVSIPEGLCPALDARIALVISLLITPTSALEPGRVDATPARAPVLPDAQSTRLPELPEEPKVTLHLESDDPATRLVAVMHRGVNGPLGSAFIATTVLCGPPCDRDVPRGTKVFVSGAGIVPSSEVDLGLGVASRAFLDVHAGHFRERTLAVFGLTFGVAGLATSALSLLLGAILRDPAWLIGAGVSGALGVGLTIAGAAGFSATTTRVDVSSR